MASTDKGRSPADNVTDLATARRDRQTPRAPTRPGRPAAGEAAVRPDTESFVVSDSLSVPVDRDHGASLRNDENRKFDQEKVDRIKARIRDGSYEIDPVRVADKFIEHERN